MPPRNTDAPSAGGSSRIRKTKAELAAELAALEAESAPIKAPDVIHYGDHAKRVAASPHYRDGLTWNTELGRWEQRP